MPAGTFAIFGKLEQLPSQSGGRATSLSRSNLASSSHESSAVDGAGSSVGSISSAGPSPPAPDIGVAKDELEVGSEAASSLAGGLGVVAAMLSAAASPTPHVWRYDSS